VEGTGRIVLYWILGKCANICHTVNKTFFRYDFEDDPFF
jgi:hypothetical protein